MSTRQQKKSLEEQVNMLGRRLGELETGVLEVDRPMYETALLALRAAITHAGRQLIRIGGLCPTC